MERKFRFSPEEYYHIYNRGTDKRDIFLDNHDHNRFMVLLYLCNSKNALDMRNYFNEGRTFVELFGIERGETLVDIGAYCLMPNHFHLLVREKNDNNISIFMRKLLTGYSMYFNKRCQRTGSLFEGKFKANHVDNDAYLKYLFSYIHLNPVKLINKEWKEDDISDRNKAHNHLQGYTYSSYLDYHRITTRKESVILNKSVFPEYFSQPKEFEDFIKEWLDIKDLFS